MNKVLLLLMAVAAVAVAQIPSLGFCPDYVPMADFNINNFLGKWYEAERYFTVSEVASRCVTTDYTKGPSGKIYVSNEITSRLTGIKRVIDGQLDLTGKVGEGKMTVKYTSFPPYDTTYKILDTDYMTYAVVWSCNGIGPVNTQNAWVYTRERSPPKAAMQRAYGVLDKYKISRTFFLQTDQKDCALGGAVEESAATSTAEPPKADPATTIAPSAAPEAKNLEQEPTDQIKIEPVPIAEHILKVAETKPEELPSLPETAIAQDSEAEIPVKILTVAEDKIPEGKSVENPVAPEQSDAKSEVLHAEELPVAVAETLLEVNLQEKAEEEKNAIST